LQPWINWGDNKNPNWWTDYNKIKHHRHDYYKRAHLKNLLNSMAGLFVLLMFYHMHVAVHRKLSPKPTLFNMPGLFFRAPDIWGDILKIE